MVRFYWHVDDGCSAHVPVNGVTLASTEPTHLAVEMDVPGVAGSAVGLMSMPPCTAEGKSPPLRRIGVVIAHDVDASSWQGPLLTSIAQCLAKKGFLVMRNYCNLKELRRLRMFEKALDTVSKSPYATHAGVDSWLLVGMGNGARVAATVSSKAKTSIAGLAVVSYPLHENTPPAGKGAGFPDSTSQLMKCSAPLLVLQGETDSRCSVASMHVFLRQARPQPPGAHFGVLAGVNENLLGANDAILNARTLVCKAILDFAEALSAANGPVADLNTIPSAHSNACMLATPDRQCAEELGVIQDLPTVPHDVAVADAPAQPLSMPESFPVQPSPEQLPATPREAAPVQLLSAHPAPPAQGAAYAPAAVPAHQATQAQQAMQAQQGAQAQQVAQVQQAMQGQHGVAMDAQQLLVLQQQRMGLQMQGGMVGVEAALPLGAPLPLPAGQLSSLPATLVAPPHEAPLTESAVAGVKPSMPLFRPEDSHQRPPGFQQ